jgi:hypothetical protein
VIECFYRLRKTHIHINGFDRCLQPDLIVAIHRFIHLRLAWNIYFEFKYSLLRRICFFVKKTRHITHLWSYLIHNSLLWILSNSDALVYDLLLFRLNSLQWSKHYAWSIFLLLICSSARRLELGLIHGLEPIENTLLLGCDEFNCAKTSFIVF